MKNTPYTFLILFILFNACATYSRYEVHLVDGKGTHHLLTTQTEDEALSFIDDQQDSHGSMKIIKFK